jgi:mRNA interferase MazF
VKRGEVWTVTGGSDYTGKPRPAVIVQDNAFLKAASVTVCAFTTDPTTAPLFRLLVEPSATNGLKSASRLMVDKVVTVPRAKIGKRLGVLDEADVAHLNTALIVFLGLAAPARRRGRRKGRAVT